MTESLTGFPLPAKIDRSSLRPVLERIAQTSTKHLLEGGYLSDTESGPILPAYGQALASSSPPADFLSFVAETQASKHSVTVEGEISRMQKLLRSRLNDRVHYWSFGPLPGRASALYEHCPGLKAVCSTLGCPATLAGETSIVHVASINPVAALVASFWISHELNRAADGDAPFVFSFLTDLPIWQTLMQNHFDS
ncbi:hypothetical protein SAMN02745166_00901 [Prosthecobacter debontii]|uniref:Uncharacterized protein n=1 Tax=Prosthecobacter debontii TaxID=48467 RepID=A0A1T4X0J9_9BACT|nr:hypothetical protein [Prosthecobacter debontii]SKA82391.1 hypothetical protein SAMN02745166_00901 [Prosthecobacter debontii]